MTSKLFSDLGLSAESLQAVEKLGFEQASPIQAEAIPVLLAGKDIVGQSQTGSGKTAAFGIPAVEKVDPARREVQVLILCPTRELAVQVSEEIHKLALFKRGLQTLPIYGGQSYERQFYGLKQGAQIVIGTPGRIMDHMRRGTLRLDTVKMAILDEADVMLNMGFRDDIETILQAVPAERQTVFFSATIPEPIRELIEKYSREPQTVQIAQKSLTVPTVEQIYYEVDRRNKMELLTRLIDLHDLKLGIIFCNTKRMVDDLVDHLEAAGYQADRLHGDMTQNMRDRVMHKFRQSGLEFLVATDVAARGIDVDDVEVVFNYDLPYDPEDYVHRIGRTGRAGKSGRAISLVPYRELFQIRNIERFANVRIQRGKIPTVDEVAEARENAFLEKLRALLASGGFPNYEHLLERLLEEGFSSADIVSALIHQLQSGEGVRHQAPTEEYEQPARDERRVRAERRERGPRGDQRAGRFEDRRQRAAREPRRPRPEERRERPARSAGAPFSAPAGPHPAAGRADDQHRAKAQDQRTMATPPAASETKPAAEKTYSDAEILASIKNPEPKPESKLFLKPKPLPAPPKPKVSRATPKGQTRLWMNLGEFQGIKPIDIVNAVAGETGLPGKVVGTVDVREKHLFVEVADEHVNGIVAKLNRAQIKGHKVKVKVA
ncbi:MAG TPA: DEAD/DEAH box helicase [Candidatus Acidoferrales bacterium]|nr:DEAD/DEAH box helicase [Candidatus Acidoferrales bacterium]